MNNDKEVNDLKEAYMAHQIRIRAETEAENLLATLETILDAIDYTSGACRVNEMVGAVLPKELIQKARMVIARAK